MSNQNQEEIPLLVLTNDNIKDIINNDTTIKESTKKKWLQTLSTFMKMFPDLETFTDVFNKYTDIEIIAIIIRRYPNLGTHVQHIQLILKIYNLSPEFGVFLTKTRYTYISDELFEIDQYDRHNRETSNKNDTTDYMDNFIGIFEKELELRRTEPASINHIISIIYTIGAYSSQTLENDSLVYVPRIDELRHIKLVNDDKDIITNEHNYYNYENGRLVINTFKTDGNSEFWYDYVMNPLAASFIKINVLKRTPENNEFLYPNNIELKIRQHVLPNRLYRRVFQNVYDKILMKPLDSMTKPMAHSIDTATKYYSNNKKYTEEEILINRLRIVSVFKLSETM